jgi:hypothetical protein
MIIAMNMICVKLVVQRQAAIEWIFSVAKFDTIVIIINHVVVVVDVANVVVVVLVMISEWLVGALI